MRNFVESSVVIPVFNQWRLTSACLRALKDTLTGKSCEIIVVDNASTDATQKECPRLGKALFGDFFYYHRSEKNLNFGPASNLGAKLATGEFLIFLNNDTIPLPGWYEPLLDDFTRFPDIAATGPLLLYPESEPFGLTVQHLGVFISPALQVGHLYEGIPADSALAKKRRFFQAITAACMVIRRTVFCGTGMFDEGYINGFEDVDLCLRLWQAGYRMTINPEARVIHHTSQTPGRHTHETENSRRLIQQNVQMFVPDWHIHLKNDGYMPSLSPWQTLHGALPEKRITALRTIEEKGSFEDVKYMLLRFPLWKDGYAALMARMQSQGLSTAAIELSFCKLWPSPESLLHLYGWACENNNTPIKTFTRNGLLSFCRAYESYIVQARAMRQWTRVIGLEALALQYTVWLRQDDDFREQRFLPFLQALREQMQLHPFRPEETWAYTLWRELADLPARAPGSPSLLHTPDGGITFSVLMPVYNPKYEHIAAAVDSLLNQSYPHWELCIADDASPAPGIKPMLQELAEKDARVRIVCREKNGHIAAATNTALAMARNRYAALMDQDDLLTPDALCVMAKTIAEHPEGMLFYSDEDKITDDGNIFYPYFKNNAWDADLLLGQNMINHLGVYVTARLRAIGGFREGFNGAQDHDMLLRYTADVDPSHCIHISQTLYHWRMHEGSTAMSIGAKPEALGSAVRALTQHLERMDIAGSVELHGHQYYRIRYALPEPPPLVSLIVDLGSGCSLAPALTQVLLEKTGYAELEIIFVYDAESDPGHSAQLEDWASAQARVKLLPQERRLAHGARMNAAAAAARGTLMGFLGANVVPLSADWLEEIISRLTQKGVGAVGGRILNQRGRVYHQGYSTDAGGRLFSLFREAFPTEPGYFAWLALARTVDALEPRCLFTHKAYLDDCNGFVPHLGGAGAIDFCLRMKDKKLRSVTTPFAEFLLLDSAYKAVDWENGIFVNDAYLHAHWNMRLKPCSPHLEAGIAGWSLHLDNVRAEVADGSSAIAHSFYGNS